MDGCVFVLIIQILQGAEIACIHLKNARNANDDIIDSNPLIFRSTH